MKPEQILILKSFIIFSNDFIGSYEISFFRFIIFIIPYILIIYRNFEKLF